MKRKCNLCQIGVRENGLCDYCGDTKKNTQRTYDKYRGSPKERGYDSVWEKLRTSIIQTKPLCRICLANGFVVSATEVDHIIPIKVKPNLRLVKSNLQSLCHSCHMQKTEEDKKKYKQV